MNKSQLREFAITSRVALIESVKLRAYAYGVTEEKLKKNQIAPSAQQLNPSGGLLTNEERAQRDELLHQIEQKGFAQVMEEAAYTWFNRFIAIRYMEAQQLLPIRQRVFARKGEVRPELIADALNIQIDGLDRARMIALIEQNEDERLYKLQLIALANSLHAVLPQMFEEIDNYTELLFPEGLLQKDSVLARMAALSEDNWQDIEVVGWLYQYYNTELKDETFALLKKNVKITKERIGAATQLFTPEWIVRYMVENSLGRLWLEGHENATLQSGWKYYLPEAEQEPQVAEKLKELRKNAANLRPEQISVLDPCMGSGHILVVAFDVLMGIYRSVGYTDRDAVRSIIENNLYGLDIDDRAAQLAYFAVMMKACLYDKRFLRRANVPQPHVCAIQESNGLEAFEKLQGQLTLDKLCLSTANELIRAFHDAKEYGSILDVHIDGLDSTDALMAQLRAISQPDLDLFMWLQKAEKLLPQLSMQAEIMQRKYDVVVTNPPYMGGRNINGKLLEYIVSLYPDGKADLYSTFILRVNQLTKSAGYYSMITQHSWMFLSSFESLRNRMRFFDIINMCHLGPRAFEDISGEVVQTTAWIQSKRLVKSYRGKYIRLISFESQNEKEKAFLSYQAPTFLSSITDYELIPGHAFGYWLANKNVFNQGAMLEAVANPRQGLKTLDNDYYIHFWYEVSHANIYFDADTSEKACHSLRKWFPINHGGEYRKYYGNNYTVVNWFCDGEEMKKLAVDKYGCISRTITNISYYFMEGITWSVLCTSPSFRYYGHGFIFSNGGQCIVPDGEVNLAGLTGLLNSKVTQYLLNILSPTLGYESGYVKKIPILPFSEYDKIISDLAEKSIGLSRFDWDSYEISWDFERHPLLEFRGFEGMPEDRPKRPNCTIASTYHMYQVVCEERFRKLKSNEEALNRIFIDIYGLKDELTPEVADKDVTVYRVIDEPNAEERGMRYVLSRKDVIVSLISYAVGCIFGRYSLDETGLILAGQPFGSRFVYRVAPVAGGDELDTAVLGMSLKKSNGEVVDCSFTPDKDAILPIADDEYFDDDIVGRFVKFIEVVYGKDTLTENLRFIADALGGESKPPKDVIRAYFLNDFYKDHLKTYQKRPIYWLFDSGKQNGFKALVYLHRYDRDTLARMRTDYVHPQQERLRTQIDGETHAMQTGDVRRKAVAAKRLDKLQKQLMELAKFEEQLHHLADERIELDLDDGVKVNYAKMGELVQPIK